MVGCKADNLRNTEQAIIAELERNGIPVESKFDMFQLKVNPPADYFNGPSSAGKFTSLELRSNKKQVTDLCRGITENLLAKTVFNYAACFKHHHHRLRTTNLSIKRVFLEPFTSKPPATSWE